jgi:uncharacterized membrane protein
MSLYTGFLLIFVLVIYVYRYNYTYADQRMYQCFVKFMFSLLIWATIFAEYIGDISTNNAVIFMVISLAAALFHVYTTLLYKSNLSRTLD